MDSKDLWAKWWAAQSENRRARLKGAAEQDRLDADTAQFVLDTSPPIGLSGSKWETEAAFSWTMSPSLREFIRAQP
ncbi:hypothetical protein [Mycobacteroides abscessus]